ncbi:hypothetical protein BDD12DRAFT_938741 [Trichophaea hybrida]|nr:hypothetical protein BDD12DRAFT_938741 [Trichophaea hybrida]
MAETILPGGYVIRNRDSSAVLYAEHAAVSTCEHDEERHRAAQIWWIEAEPGSEALNDRKDGAKKVDCVYRISNITKDMSLDEQHNKRGPGAPVIIYKTHGGPWQLWHRSEYYYIICAYSGYSLDAGNDQCCTREPDTKSKKQSWEPLKPVVSVPAGWLRLQNIASGHLLSQTYPSLPPLAIPATSSRSTYREHWATEWVFERQGTKIYAIKNRLTGTYLRCEWSKLICRGEAAGSVNAWKDYCYGVKPEQWNLELDAEPNWKIVHNSGLLLEEAVVPLLDGYEIVCTTKLHDKRKSWAFIPSNSAVERLAGLSSPPPVYNPAANYQTNQIETCCE